MANPIDREILTALSQPPPRMGKIWQERFSLHPDRLDILWRSGLIQGDRTDGCCELACGSQCTSYNRSDRLWQISRPGERFIR